MKAGFVGLIGLPNSGKSTLMNFLIEEKVSIVTPRPQTTRRRVHGIWNNETEGQEAQIVFVDAPGLVTSKPGLFDFLAKEAEEVMSESDVLIAVLSLDLKSAEEAQSIVAMVAKSGKPWLAVINKIDLEAFAHRALILKDILSPYKVPVISMSCTRQDTAQKEDRELLLQEIQKLLPESPAPLYDPELYTTESLRDMACEIVREKCFLNLKDEVPYSIAVRPIEFKEDATPVPRITLEILVSKDTHKGIVIGKGGLLLKKIGQEARQEIEKFMGTKIFLGLKVAAREDWYKNNRIMKELGYHHD
jgi:GTP-binding protein Era